MDYDLKDTIVALSTPPGSGAIGVIRLSGEKAIDIVTAVFKGKDLSQQESHTAHFGRITSESGQLIDEVVVTLFVAPRSYTKENIVEVSCHGSPYIQQQLIQLFITKGARLARAGEFTLRAYLNGQMDLSQAEAVADLIASTSAGAHQLAMNQMRGGISKEIGKLRDELIHFASLIELELDFGEEDVTFADRKDLQELIEKIQSMLRRLLDSFQLGNAIKEGIQTVIAGRPNAGKSTLLNALLNEDRAIVSNIAGTTRDTIEEVLNINGVEFRLVDTAGIREARDQIEAIGVEKTFEKISQSSLLVYVFDVVMLRPAEVIEDLKKLAAHKIPLLVIANKMDLNPYTKIEHYLAIDTASEYLDENNFVPVSAINQMNIPYLKEKLFQTAIDKKLGSESTMISSTRHHTALQAAYERLTSVTEGLHNGITGDFLAMDIRQVLHHLGEISGEVTPDDLLGNIFGKFCIGK